MRTSALVAVMILFTGNNCWAHDFAAGDLSRVVCGTTLYSWSMTPDNSPTEIATGSVTDTSDGHGKWVKGRLVLQILPPQNSAADKQTCIYDLVSGDYSVNPNGSGIAHNSWKPASSSDPRCASLHLDGFAAGGANPESKPRAGAATESFYLNNSNSGYQIAVGPAGFAAGTCKPAD